MTTKPTYTKTLSILASGQIKLCDLLETTKKTNSILHNVKFANMQGVTRLLNMLETQTYLIDLMRSELQDLTEHLQSNIPK